jgi:hypothetical protein
LPAERGYGPGRTLSLVRSAALSNSPFLTPSRKHSHSFRSKTSTRPAGSPTTRISTQSPRDQRGLSGNAISIEPFPSPDRSQASPSGSRPSSVGVGLMASSLMSLLMSLQMSLLMSLQMSLLIGRRRYGLRATAQ